MQHLLSARLVALNPISRPQVLPIEARQLGDEFVVGRTNFFTGEDTIISRRHAKFKITSHTGGPEMLVVENLSMINGMLVNFRPIQPYQAVTIYDADEIVRPSILFVEVNGTVFFRGTWIDRGDYSGRFTY
jgi:hypothetical protein